MSRVICVGVWPRCSEPTLSAPPAVNANVAATWRTSWKRIGGRSLRSTSRSKRCETPSGDSGLPSSLVKTSPVSCHGAPHEPVLLLRLAVGAQHGDGAGVEGNRAFAGVYL